MIGTQSEEIQGPHWKRVVILGDSVQSMSCSKGSSGYNYRSQQLLPWASKRKDDSVFNIFLLRTSTAQVKSDQCMYCTQEDRVGTMYRLAPDMKFKKVFHCMPTLFPLQGYFFKVYIVEIMYVPTIFFFSQGSVHLEI